MKIHVGSQGSKIPKIPMIFGPKIGVFLGSYGWATNMPFFVIFGPKNGSFKPQK